MDPIQWLESNERYFSIEMNGYGRPPIGPYLSTMPLIDKDGKILDLGCGNGMLLKFLMRFSGHDLLPYGVDSTKKAIIQAQQILPQYKDNFEVNDVKNYHFRDGPFAMIISSPFYAYPKMREYTEKCLDNLSAGGKLIYRIHDDILKSKRIDSLEDVKELKGLGLRVSQGLNISFGIFQR